MEPRKKLKQLREEKGYTQTQMAKKLKISQAGYAEIERGARPPSFCVTKKLLEMFDVTFEELFLESNNGKV